MRKIKISIIILFVLTLLPMVVFAQSQPSVISLRNPLSSETFEELIAAIINWLLIVTLPIVSLLIVYAAFQIMVTGANPKQREEAINIIKYALIGYGVILSSKIIVAIIQTLFGGS